MTWNRQSLPLTHEPRYSPARRASQQSFVLATSFVLAITNLSPPAFFLVWGGAGLHCATSTDRCAYETIEMWLQHHKNGGVMPAYLVAVSGAQAGKQFPLTDAPCSFGRNPDNAIVVASARASRRHAEIRREGGDFILYDLGSANGTLVNGQRIAAPHRLRSGDLIEIGDETFRFEQPQPAVDATLIASPGPISAPPTAPATPPQPAQGFRLPPSQPPSAPPPSQTPPAPPPYQPPPAQPQGFQVPPAPPSYQPPPRNLHRQRRLRAKEACHDGSFR